MKQLFVVLSASALFLTACVDNPDGKKAETGEAGKTMEITADLGVRQTVNPEASNIEWLGKKITGQHHGSLQVKSGEVFVKDGRLTGGNFILDLTSITNKDLEGEYKGKLETHLKSADFFDVDNHPEASFEITDVKPGTTQGQAIISGNLTIRGITKNITFDADVQEATEKNFKATADFNIAREDWGVSYAGKADDLISKEINLKINLVAAG